jgi:hypothetical protein
MTQIDNARDLRVLAADELDAVNGGIIDGCIRFPKLPLPKQPDPFTNPKEQVALA